MFSIDHRTLKLTSILIFTFVISQVAASKKGPIILDEDSWTQLLKGEWMVDLYAPWCPACKKLEPEWKKFSEWADDLSIGVASIDVTTNPGLSGRFMVRGLPTIYHIKDGVLRNYNGPREHTALINFIEENNWKTIEPVSRWMSPDTFQMSFLAYLFRISMALKDIHTHLVDNVGLPYYVSYTLFALCTLTLGMVLGLLIVFVVDSICPAPHQQAKKAPVSKKKNGKGNDSDLEDIDSNGAKTSNPERLRKRTKS